jgi:hypothetical protein
MHLINEAFRKQQILEAGCQLLIACHSSKQRNQLQIELHKLLK